MLKVLLVNPSTKGMLVGNNPAFLDDLRGCNPPLGLLYIAAYLRKYTRHAVNVVDEQISNALEFYLSWEKPEVVGITATTFVMRRVVEIIDLVRKLSPKSRIILGGVHPTLYPAETMDLGVDAVITGEAEKIFPVIIDENLRGVYSGSPQDINTLPNPWRVNQGSYNSVFSNGIATTIITSRGCPYRCSFCNRATTGGVFRARAPKEVVNELVDCVCLGIRDFMFYDDTFTFDRNRAIDICRRIIQSKMKIRFDVRSRVDRVDAELLRLLKLAGMVQIHMGIESGSPRILEILNKKITVEEIRDAFKMCRKAGIRTLGYIMIGNPGDDVCSIIDTQRLVAEVSPDFLHATVFTPLPGTDSYHNWVSKTGDDVWRDFAVDPRKEFEPPVWIPGFREYYEDTVVETYRKFYMRPSYIAKRALSIRGLGQMKKYVRAGLGILKGGFR